MENNTTRKRDVMQKALIIATLALLGMAARPVHGQQGKLVVTPFENRGAKLDTAALNNLQDYLINAFINTGRFQVPDRNALALLAQEQKFQLSDWADDSKSAQMGKVLNADYIVRVIAMHDGEYNLLTARILDVNTANGLSAAEMEFITQREARGKMEGFVTGILTRIGGGSRPAPPASRPQSGARGGVPEGFVLVEGGTFTMGSPSNEPDRDSD
jgi:TolB-like protein